MLDLRKSGLVFEKRTLRDEHVLLSQLSFAFLGSAASRCAASPGELYSSVRNVYLILQHICEWDQVTLLSILRGVVHSILRQTVAVLLHHGSQACGATFLLAWNRSCIELVMTFSRLGETKHRKHTSSVFLHVESSQQSHCLIATPAAFNLVSSLNISTISAARRKRYS